MGDIFLETDTIPPEWKVSRIGDEAEFTRKPRDLDISLWEAVPFIPMDRRPADGLYTQHHETRTPDQLTSGVFFTNGDILLAKITPCLENGKQAIAKDIPGGWGFATTEVFPIRPKSHDTEFLAFYLRVAEVRRLLATKMQGATGRQRLPREAVENFPVPVPPLPEQHAIAHVLRTVQQAKEETQKVVAGACQLKQSLMWHLFTYGPVPFDQADRVPLKETEVGPVAQHWIISSLGEVICIGPQNGVYKPKSDYGTGFPIVRINDFDNSGSVVEVVPNRVRLSEDEVRTYGLTTANLLVNRVNSLSHLGRTAIVGQLAEPTVFESNMMRFGVDAGRTRPGFVFRFLNLPAIRKLLCAKSKRAVAQSSVNQEDVKGLSLPIPPVEEQDKLLQMVAAAEAKIRSESARMVALHDLYQTLLHNLMTGKVRVHDVLAFASAGGSNGHRQ